MTGENESGLLSSYTGLNGRTLVTFFALVAGVLVVVTGIYVAIFGFQNWKEDMKQAGSMMVAGFNTPANGLAPAAPTHLNRSVAPSPVVPGAAQYVCPSCGAVGLPKWSPNGAPVCPNCGSVMAVAGRAPTSLHLAARP